MCSHRLCYAASGVTGAAVDLPVALSPSPSSVPAPLCCPADPVTVSPPLLPAMLRGGVELGPPAERGPVPHVVEDAAVPRRAKILLLSASRASGSASGSDDV